MSLKGVFVTGTDTGVGKTVTSALLVSALNQAKLHSGAQAKYFKPVQTGLDSDTETLKGLTKCECLEPIYKFRDPISPNRAAALAHEIIDLRKIKEAVAGQDFLVIEGAGGIMVPLNRHDKIRELIRILDIPLIVVASTQLGTINHTLLTIECAKSRGLKILGVVLVGDEDPGLKEVLVEQGDVPVIAEIPNFEVSPSSIKEQAPKVFNHETLSQISGKAMSLLERDQKVLWHPYTQHGLQDSLLVAKTAKGAWITLEDDTKILDGISSWWVNLHGHSQPLLSRTLFEQAEKLEHTLFAGFTHQPAVELAELLIAAVSPYTRLEKVFFSDNGSTAVEVALKMAFQYHLLRNNKSKTKFLALHGAYHGDTFGAMAVGEPTGFHNVFRPLLPQVDFVRPGRLKELEECVEKNKGQYAAFIFEPLVQGAGGMVMYEREYLIEAQKICRANDILMICDEIFTGFYRTGKAFAFEHAGIDPDFVCLSKGITGGYLPLAATLTTQNIFETFLSQETSKAFLHGHSYTANPLACAVAVASWGLLNTVETQGRIQSIVSYTEQMVSRFKNEKLFSNPRALGTIGAVNLNFDFNYMSGASSWFKRKAIEKGVLLRPLGPVLYAVPPYCVTPQEIEKIYNVIYELAEEYLRTLP